MIVDSCARRRVPAWSPHDAHAGLIKSYEHRAVIVQSPQGDGTVIMRSPCDVSTNFRRVYIGFHKPFVSFQHLSSNDVYNRVTQLQLELRRNRRREQALIVALAVFEQQQARHGRREQTVWVKP